MTDQNVWQKRFERERSARQQAEALLETKSRDLYKLNESLNASRDDLEKQVEQRTQALQSAIGKLKDEIRKRRLVEKELVSARDTALELSDLKTEFIARMSHEIRTPLNAVIGLTGLLLDSELSEEQTKHLNTVRSSGILLLRIINDILDLSKIDADKIELEYMPVPVDRLIEKSLSLVMLDAEKKGINFELEKERLLPDEIVVDGGRVQQLLLNLLSNAVKYSDAGTVRVSVGLADDTAPMAQPPAELSRALTKTNASLKTLTITVEDEGVGIDEKDLESLFDPFTQFAGASTGSSGLGLTICQRLCQIMGGGIEVESHLGSGSRFTVSMLCGATAANVAASDKKTTILRSTSETGAWLLSGHMDQLARQRRHGMAHDKPLTILLADDYEVNRMVQRAQLEQLGYRVDAVANGEEVLRALYARSYDVVLMDVRMPVMDGVEATRRIRRRVDGVQPYVVAVTASAMADDKQKYVDAGMDAYLSKPVELDALAAVLDSAYEVTASRETGSKPDDLPSPAVLDFAPFYARLGEAADGLLFKVIPVFLRELPGRERRLQDAYANTDAQAFAQICHGLKGASRSIGATELADCCETMEIDGFAGTLPDKRSFDALLDLTQRTGAALRHKLASVDMAEPAA